MRSLLKRVVLALPAFFLVFSILTPVQVAFAVTANYNVNISSASFNLTAGGVTGSETFSISATGGSSCSFPGGAFSLSLSSSDANVATASTSSLSFADCNATNTVVVTPVGTGSANLTFAQTSTNSGASFHLGAGKFIVNVSAPADTTPPVIVPGCSVNGTSVDCDGWHNSDVTVEWSVSDAESTVTSTTGCTTTVISTETAGTDVTCQATSSGGSTQNTATILLDKTPPTITDLGPTTSPNANNWYNADVTNQFKADDTLSGLSASCLANYPLGASNYIQELTTTGEGTVNVTSADCSDEAGNTTTGITSSDFLVDETAPVITDLGPTTAANSNGWYNADVTNQFKASDTSSGIDDACLANYPLGTSNYVQELTTTGEGTVHVTSSDCADMAGNTASGITSADFQIDQTAPDTPQASPGTTGNYTNTQSVSLTSFDALAGLEKICYTIDFTDPSACAHLYDGTPITVDQSMTISALAYDNAGNQSGQLGETYSIDNDGPTLNNNLPSGDYTGTQSLELSADDSLSGVENIYYTTDGSTPDNTSTPYTTAITINKDMTVKAIAYDVVGNASAVMELTYGIAPAITAETSNSPTTTSVTITWTTDNPATSRVVYGTSSVTDLAAAFAGAPNYGYPNSTTEDSTLTTNHSVNITGLVAGSTYYYRTVSHGSPENYSAEKSFTTNSQPVGGKGGGGSSSTTTTTTSSTNQPAAILASAVTPTDSNSDNGAVLGENTGDQGKILATNTGSSTNPANISNSTKADRSWLWGVIVTGAAVFLGLIWFYRRQAEK